MFVITMIISVVHRGEHRFISTGTLFSRNRAGLFSTFETTPFGNLILIFYFRK